MKVSVVLLAGTEAHADLARVLNALELVRECMEGGDEVELVFDGAAVAWIPILADPDHSLHKVFHSVRPHIAGACEFCAGAFDVKGQIRGAQVAFLSEFEGHPSLRTRLVEDWKVVTF
ncbi:MAG: hypothetical protein EA422_07630 [Gemmatimonadales bacterium]|nr:MAG: hypothetical protein EA422_07630 [Gemmatimonadales bacterium]